MSIPQGSEATFALLNQSDAIGAELRAALQALGARVVYESPLHVLDRAALKASGARVVVINLGDDEDAVDDIQDLFEANDYEIVINDNAVSALLTGADQARWARHLAAKILRRPEIVLPPRPAGAEALPTFNQHWAARVPEAEVIGVTEPKAPSAAALPSTPISNAPVVVASSSAAIDPQSAPAKSAQAEADGLDASEDHEWLQPQEHFETAVEPSPPAHDDRSVADFEALLAATHDHEAIAHPTATHDDISADLASAPRGAAAPTESTTAMPDDDARSAPPDLARPRTNEFGIEMVPADVYLSPHVDPEPATPVDVKELGAAIPSGFSSALELVPLESEADTKPKNTVLYDTGRDLHVPTHVPKPPKHDDSKPSKED